MLTIWILLNVWVSVLYSNSLKSVSGIHNLFLCRYASMMCLILTAILSAVSHSSSSATVCLWVKYDTPVITLFIWKRKKKNLYIYIYIYINQYQYNCVLHINTAGTKYPLISVFLWKVTPSTCICKNLE